jgi:23S rRNA pseudouridine1911/1915/1917 synthase
MMNSGYVFHNRVSGIDTGKTVLEFYRDRYPRFSAEEWCERIRAGQVTSGGDVLNEESILAADQILLYHRTPWEEPDVTGEIEVLHDDEHITVFYKPDGMQVLPAGNILETSMVSLLRERRDPRLSPLHRLGRGTTGAILFTKTVQAARELSRAMRERRIRKAYLTIVSDGNLPDEFVIDKPIGRVPHPALGMVHDACEDGKPSLSACFVLARSGDSALLRVEIHTGRTHQIRIHLASIGHPISGDRFYGTESGADENHSALPGDAGYILHSWKIGFMHPIYGHPIEITADPPEIYLKFGMNNSCVNSLT